MMSKKQWFVLLCVYVAYLLLGAAVFQEVESDKEYKEQKENRKERNAIEDLLVLNYVPSKGHPQEEIFQKLATYCGKPLSANKSDVDPPIRWDYYHSLFFVITVVSTIGYGNLAPTTTLTRIFMIFYAIVGMPMNGMLIINLGDYFGKSFLKLYDRWKTKRVQHALATLGLVGQVVLYLIPGFTFFIFIPSILIMVFEGWPYDVAVHYAFVTLTTIGFGDWVAGTTENDHGETWYMIYKIFLLVWIISGLGYLCMVMGFVARGMRSKKMCAIEHKLAVNIKRTNHKIREELRSIVNEYLLLRVKRVYREKFIYVPNKPQRSQSCPNLTIHSVQESPTVARKRAFSTCAEYDGEISRIQSDSDLERIDKEQTFNPSNAVLEPGQFLLRVANALGNIDTVTDDRKSIDDHSYVEGINLFPSTEILATEKYDSNWSIGNERISAKPGKVMRPRAASECRTPVFARPPTEQNDLTWYGPSATKRLQELREQVKFHQIRHKSLPPFTPSAKPQSLFSRLKNSLKPTKESDNKDDDIESQIKQKEKENAFKEPCYAPASRRASMFSLQNEQVLEETSIADFLRALTAITVPEAASETIPLTPTTPHRSRRQPIQSQQRRTSLMPLSEHHRNQERRFSLRPEPTGTEPPPPYYPPDLSSVVAKRAISRGRSSSLRPGNTSSSSTSLQRNVLKRKYPITKDIHDTDSKNSSNI